MSALGERISHSDTPKGLEVRIQARKQPWLLVFIPVWLTAWTVGGIFTIATLVTGNAGSAAPFLLLWLCGWSAGWVFTAFAWSWNAYGFERVSIDGREFVVGKELFGRRWLKTFSASDVTNLRAAGYFGYTGSFESVFVPWGLAGGTIAFDLPTGSTQRFGIQLEETESREVVDLLKRRLPDG